MRLTIKTKTLQSLINQLEAIPDKNNVSILSGCVGIAADIEGVRAVRTTTASAISVSCEAGLDEEGSCVVSLASLRSVASGLRGSEVELEEQGEWIRVKSGEASARLRVVTDPKLTKEIWEVEKDRFNFEPKITVKASELREVFNAVSVAAASVTDSSKELFQCVAILPHQDGAMVASTNRHCFHFAHKVWAVEKQSLIPVAIVGAISKALADIKGSVKVAFTDAFMGILGTQIKLALPLLNGAWPSMNTVIITPKPPTEIKCDREELIQAIREASAFAPAIKKVRFSVDKRKLEIHAENEAGDSFDKTIKVAHSGSKVFSANYQYLLNALAFNSEPEVKIGVLDKPTFITIDEGERKAVIAQVV